MHSLDNQYRLATSHNPGACVIYQDTSRLEGRPSMMLFLSIRHHLSADLTLPDLTLPTRILSLDHQRPTNIGF